MLCIWTTQRTGSSWLCQLLNQHPNFRCYGEIYHPRPVAESTKGPQDLLPDLRFGEFDGGHRAYHAHLRERAGGDFGFKLMYDQTRPPHLMSLLGRARMVHLVRDPWDACLSHAVKVQTGVAHSTSQIDIEPFAIEPHRFHRRVRLLRRLTFVARQVIRAWPHIEVTYADLSADPQGQANRIFAHLGLPAAQVGDGTLKKLRDSYRDVITNYDALVSASVDR